MYCKNTQALTRQSAGKSTFSRALKYAYDNEGVRMMNCKGAMNTCETRVMQRDVVKITGNNAYTAIQSENSKESGYICWLLDSNGRVGLPPINEVKPKAYDPKDILDTLDDSSGKNARLNDALMTELIMLSNIFNAS